MVFRTFLASLAILAVGQHAAAFNSYDAFEGNTVGSITNFYIAQALGESQKFTATTLVDHSIKPTPLTEADINRIVGQVENSPLRSFGIGSLGGGIVSIELDGGQLQRILSLNNEQELNKLYNQAENKVHIPTGDLSPKFEVKNLSTLTTEQIAEELKGLQGTMVRTVTYRGLFQRGADQVLGKLQLFFLVGAGTNAAFAAVNGTQAVFANREWQCEDTKCDKNVSLSYLFNSSEAVFYQFHAE